MPRFADAVVSSPGDDPDPTPRRRARAATAAAPVDAEPVRDATARARRRRARRPARPPERPASDPDGGHGDVHELLKAAVDEAARLLDADGAMVYLVDPATGHLRFAHDAGIRSRRSRELGPLDRPAGRRRDVRAGGRASGRSC